MTLGNIFGSAMSSTPSTYYNRYPTSRDSQQILSERDGGSYSYGISKKSKGKLKADKKHAAMSALTLLAFLFFLNILQNCLREQTQPIASEVTMMMMMPAKHIKDGAVNENDREGKITENPWNGIIRRSRSLLQFQENQKDSNRHVKFIRDYKEANHNWANGLTQLSEKELESHRMKTNNLQTYLSNIRGAAKLIPVETKLRVVKEPIEFESVKVYSSDNDWVPKVGPVYRPVNRTNSTGIVKKILTKEISESRSRRSDLTSVDEGVKGEAQVVTPSVGLDLNTYKTYPVHNYYNHRQASYWNQEDGNDTTTTTTTSSVVSTKEAERIDTPTTEYYPLVTNPYQKYPQNRYRFTHINRYHQPRYPIESKYKYSPYRKSSNNYHAHGGYYPVTVLRESEDEEVGFDFLKFVWKMLSGLARPLTKMMPGLAKVGNDEPRCYDLLVCEAHRVSRFMGPTAEALAATFSTLLTWYTPEENRQVLLDAVSSGRENTCQQQIQNCNERSGGKSAMTVLAEVLEMKFT